MTKELMQILKPLRQLGGFIIGGSEPISEMTFKRMWERIGKTVDLRGATPHVFRYTFITLAASSGVDIKTLQGIAGHSDVRMTMERYAHVRVEKVREAGAQIEAVFEALCQMKTSKNPGISTFFEPFLTRYVKMPLKNQKRSENP